MPYDLKSINEMPVLKCINDNCEQKHNCEKYATDKNAENQILRDYKEKCNKDNNYQCMTPTEKKRSEDFLAQLKEHIGVPLKNIGLELGATQCPKCADGLVYPTNKKCVLCGYEEQ